MPYVEGMRTPFGKMGGLCKVNRNNPADYVQIMSNFESTDYIQAWHLTYKAETEEQEPQTDNLLDFSALKEYKLTNLSAISFTL